MSKELIEASELLERYQKGERDFSNVYIEGSDELAGANLSDINLIFKNYSSNLFYQTSSLMSNSLNSLRSKSINYCNFIIHSHNE
ncbi:hypothetical protein DSM106972_067350 [Dulcicalothrix desertica PCC 7102]|uniref:Uncharacterized protein n=1 Tax=Dulcicalothrix desertica PCC 7102 TaxID=232991 RepID=A0A433V6C3_9CYAN|nr:hypothetical protein DSM106972_067350 [Dulcicalothrix desertica PCC 7102]